MRVFIVEDEIPAREELARLLSRHFPDMEVAGTAASVRESLDWLGRNDADLIFMDVQLSDGSCFDIFGALDVRTPVIFTTAYDRYALEAFKVNSVGYLLKPVDEDELVAAVKKLDYSYVRVQEMLASFQRNHGGYKTRISVRFGDSYASLPMERVSHFISDGGVTMAVSDSGEKFQVDYTIESLEAVLDPKTFFRATRGCIVSINSIDKVSRYFNSRLKLFLKGQRDSGLVLSRARVPEFLKWMDDR